MALSMRSYNLENMAVQGLLDYSVPVFRVRAETEILWQCVKTIYCE